MMARIRRAFACLVAHVCADAYREENYEKSKGQILPRGRARVLHVRADAHVDVLRRGARKVRWDRGACFCIPRMGTRALEIWHQRQTCSLAAFAAGPASPILHHARPSQRLTARTALRRSGDKSPASASTLLSNRGETLLERL